MAKVTVRIPEPKEQYEVDNQRQISRALRSIVEQLNSTFLTQEKEEQRQHEGDTPVQDTPSHEPDRVDDLSQAEEEESHTEE